MASRRSFEKISKLGYIKRDAAFSHVEVNSIDSSAGQADGNVFKTVRLAFPNDISGIQQRNKTQTLVEVNSKSEFIIPAGSIIREWIVQDESAGKLDDAFQFMAGYVCDEVSSVENQKALAIRVAAQNDQITGRFLNQHGSLHVDQKLTASALAAQVALYNSEASAQGLPVPATPSYAIIAGESYAGELKALKPCVTVTDGTLSASNISILVVYSPPVRA